LFENEKRIYGASSDLVSLYSTELAVVLGAQLRHRDEEKIGRLTRSFSAGGQGCSDELCPKWARAGIMECPRVRPPLSRPSGISGVDVRRHCDNEGLSGWIPRRESATDETTGAVFSFAVVVGTSISSHTYKGMGIGTGLTRGKECWFANRPAQKHLLGPDGAVLRRGSRRRREGKKYSYSFG